MFHESQKIGPYILIKKIGKGGFGEVWLAEKRTELVTKKVAIKLPLDEKVNLEDIKKEATLWEKASGHPNVLPIIDADIYDGQVVIVSEYADAGSLHDWLKTNGGKSSSVEKAVDLMIGILSGLIHLHSHKITHRDLKPSNILLHGETPRITDFGVARVVEHISRGTEAMGTPMYMSPEAFKKSTSPKTDIWSAGIVFFEMLAGYCPFYDEDIFVMIDSIRSDEPKTLPDTIPRELQYIVYKALQKNPENRFQTARAMREVLLNYKNPEGQKRFTELETTRLDVFNDDLLPTLNENFFETTTMPISHDLESVETIERSPAQNQKLPVSKIAISVAFLAAFGSFAFWQLKSSSDEINETEPPKISNISESVNLNLQPSNQPVASESVEPTETPKETIVQTKQTPVKQTINSVSTPPVKKKSTSPPVARQKPTTQPQKSTQKAENKKKLTFDDLINNKKP